jgi:lipoprotein-releasing system permease protein
MPFEWQIGWRLVRATRGAQGGGFVSFIAGVAMLGITLGVAALIVVLSVVNGFQREVRDRMLDVATSGCAGPARRRTGRRTGADRSVAPLARRHRGGTFISLPALLGRGDSCAAS